MDIDLIIENYRSFRDPVRIPLRQGLTSFLGVNNSGKSSLLRFLYECRNIFNQIAEAANNNQLAETLVQNRRGFIHAPSIFDYEEMFWYGNAADLSCRIVWNEYPDEICTPFELDITLHRQLRSWHAQLYIDGEKYESGHGPIRFEESCVTFGSKVSVQAAILPTLLESLKQTMYVGAYRNILDVGILQNPKDVRYYDIAIGRTFVENWRILKTGSKKSDYEITKRVTEDICRIFNFRSLEINTADDQTTLQVIIDGKTYRLPELGSGIAQFIVVLANAAIVRPSYILIDEPELNLHPSLQYDFLSSLASYATEGVLFATHSIGLALGYSDSVYSVRKNDDGSSYVIDYESTPRLSEFLGELNYSGYKALGFDKVLLVEGPTEVKVVQQWLRLYKLAHKVVVMHLGGGSSINAHFDLELQEITRITPNVFALIDSELDSSGKPLSPERKGFVKSCKAAGITCKVTDRRATENYFTQRAIDQVFGSPRYQALKEYQLLRQVNVSWKKRDNWRIAREMTLEELQATDLDSFFVTLSR